MEKQIYQNMIEYMENQRNSKRWGWEDSDFSDSMSQDTIYGWEEAFDEMIAGGYFTCHNPNGEWLYGADMSTQIGRAHV